MCSSHFTYIYNYVKTLIINIANINIASQRTHDLLTSFVEKLNALVPDSILKDLHSLPAVLNKIPRLQEVGARVREGFDDDGFKKRCAKYFLLIVRVAHNIHLS